MSTATPTPVRQEMCAALALSLLQHPIARPAAESSHRLLGYTFAVHAVDHRLVIDADGAPVAVAQILAQLQAFRLDGVVYGRPRLVYMPTGEQLFGPTWRQRVGRAGDRILRMAVSDGKQRGTRLDFAETDFTHYVRRIPGDAHQLLAGAIESLPVLAPSLLGWTGNGPAYPQGRVALDGGKYVWSLSTRGPVAEAAAALVAATPGAVLREPREEGLEVRCGKASLRVTSAL